MLLGDICFFLRALFARTLLCNFQARARRARKRDYRYTTCNTTTQRKTRPGRVKIG